MRAYPTETACYAALGWQQLTRQGLNNLPIVFRDTQSGGLDTGTVPLGIGTLGSGAFNPYQINPNLLPPLLNLRDVNAPTTNGIRATLGYLMGNWALEVTGFYNFESSQAQEVRDAVGCLCRSFRPARLMAHFLPGFEGNNGLFLQADRVQVSFSNEIANSEINYRIWDTGINRTELILGFRYFYSKERLGIFADDEFFVRDIFGGVDPRRQATYASNVRNHLIALQLGGEYSTELPGHLFHGLWLSTMFKSALGPNIVDRGLSLTRGDGLVGFNTHRTNVRFGGLTEAAAFLDIHLLERLRVRAGYQGLLGFNFATAGRQVQYDLRNQNAQKSDSNTVFWHGPVAELQFLF